MFNKENDQIKNISSNTPSKLDTLFGKNTKIKGDIKYSGVLHLDGTIVGSIVGSQKEDILTISESGLVEGKVEVANIVINGTIRGDIIATGKIEVASKANIEGNVYYQNIEMETGSKINGQLFYQESDKSNKISNIDEKKVK